MASKMRAASLIDGRAVQGLGAMGLESSFLTDLIAKATRSEKPDLPIYVAPEKGKLVIGGEPRKWRIVENHTATRKQVAPERLSFAEWAKKYLETPVPISMVFPEFIPIRGNATQLSLFSIQEDQ